MNFEIPYENLLNNKYKDIFKFRTTEEIEGSDRLIGQDRAEKAMEFGINIKKEGYNIYISGKNGTGRGYYARSILNNISKNYEIPDDWCYVYNFINEVEPTVLCFPPGIGKFFKQDMEYLINEVIDKISFAFNSDEYDRQKNEILEDYHDIKNMLIDELSLNSEGHNIQVKSTNSGFAFMPMINSKPMNENQYDSLVKDEKDKILKEISQVRVKAIEILRKIKAAEKVSTVKVNKLDNEIGFYVVENLISGFKNKYGINNSIIKYFDSVRDDILKHLSIFVNNIDKNALSKEEEEFLLRYKVNLIIDNSEIKGAPVVFEANPTYINLVGNIEYENKQGIVSTDFLKIRAGSMLKANGGFLIINIKDVLKNYQAWEGLKRVLKTKKIRIESIRSQLDLLTIISIKPEVISVDMKVVLIGTELLYQLLYQYDDEFQSLFKVKVDFDSEMEINNENVYKTVQFIGNYCSKNNLRHLESDGVNAIIEYSSRLTQSKRKLSSCFENIIEIINESDVWAEISGSKYINGSHIKKAILEKKKRVNLVEEKILGLYKDKKIFINVKDETVGQINGLSVIEDSGYSFGKPCRITASTYMGRSGIINIEREADMSGSIHNKSVMIVSGYLGEKYAKNIPLSLSATICFEQLYGFIEGDSASIAELYVILSSLSGIPLKQCIAVTGSLNQKGEVQPVGGINEKIEGFYKICAFSSLNCKQGVIIPYQNIDDIILEDDIMTDIKNGLFHIYAIKDVEEGIEILTGLHAGRRNDKGEFEKDSFNYYVDLKLKEFIKNYNSLDKLLPSDNNLTKRNKKSTRSINF